MSAVRDRAARDRVLARVRVLARAELGYEGPLTLSSRLVEDLALDSIRLLTLAVAVEDHFGICLGEADEAKLVRIGDLVDTVLAKTAADEQHDA